jgi:hypothetical protein
MVPKVIQKVPTKIVKKTPKIPNKNTILDSKVDPKMA